MHLRSPIPTRARGRLPRGTAITVRRLATDPYLLYTATLTPVVTAVAIARQRPAELAGALVLSLLAVGAQYALGRWAGRPLRRHGRAGSLVRIAVPLLYVGVAVQVVGGTGVPLLALFVPVVAGAAAIGAFQGWVTAGLAAAVYLLPEVVAPGTSTDVALRGLSLAGISFIIAFGTRRIVAVLQRTAHEARRAVGQERRRARQLGALQAAGNLLATAGPTRHLLEGLVEIVAVRFGYPLVSIYLGDEERVRLVAQHGYPDALPEFDPTVGVAGRVMRTGEIALVADVELDPHYVEGTIATTSLICAPLTVDDRFHGLLNVETHRGRRLDETDRTLISILATRVAIAIALGRDRQALAARAELFRDIERFGRDMSASLAIEPLATVILEAVDRIVAADTLSVTLLDRAAARYVVRAARGVAEDVVGTTVEPGEGLAGRAIRDRVLVADDASVTQPTSTSLRQPRVTRPDHGFGVPLIRDSVVVGAVTIGRMSTAERFSELELEAIQLIAGHAALAVANAFLHAEVAELAIRDSLTGLYNRRHFDDALERMLAGRRRDRLTGWRPLSAIMFDLDHFGAFNKQHGHQVGDAVLRTFADVLRTRFRAVDLVARLGGEEFVAVLDGADRAVALAAADDVRALLAVTPIDVGDGQRRWITVSAGCAELDADDPRRESLLRTADVALFMAKRAGRDRVVAA